MNPQEKHEKKGIVMNNASIESIVVGFGLDSALFYIRHDKCLRMFVENVGYVSSFPDTFMENHNDFVSSSQLLSFVSGQELLLKDLENHMETYHEFIKFGSLENSTRKFLANFRQIPGNFLRNFGRIQTGQENKKIFVVVDKENQVWIPPSEEDRLRDRNPIDFCKIKKTTQTGLGASSSQSVDDDDDDDEVNHSYNPLDD
ncbi:hypothetical protein M9H77_26717 [Catharanthus roseus]|uniref:Uncharacterized protein n=1 Tax=Catharanthus roseus TaxID=4058 RepID=A0ACC0AAT0_CATRO|nr:hypothetical protein M9H77_26717 [Catharanthus roseus]